MFMVESDSCLISILTSGESITSPAPVSPCVSSSLSLSLLYLFLLFLSFLIFPSFSPFPVSSSYYFHSYSSFLSLFSSPRLLESCVLLCNPSQKLLQKTNCNPNKLKVRRVPTRKPLASDFTPKF